MTWCIALFTTAAEADAIIGDLHEERFAIATRDGEGIATRWYWRQVLRTIAVLALAPLWQSPLTFALLGILGFALTLPLTWATFWLAGQIVVRVPMYQYVPATVFWWTASLLPHLGLGALSAVAMDRRAMSSALAVVFAMATWVVAINPLVLTTSLPPERQPGVFEYLERALAAFSLYGTALLSATAVAVAIRRRRDSSRVSAAGQIHAVAPEAGDAD